VPLTPGLSLYPTDGGRVLLLSGPVGRYELLAYTAAGDVPSDPARVVIVIEGAAPPVPPPPPDALRARLADAMARDRGAKPDVMQLAAVYREASKVAADPDVPHSKELLTRLRKVKESLLGPGVLPGVRAVAAEELLAALGMSSEEPLTDQQRARAAALFTRLATHLEDLGK
jgi:type IV secretory pathway VirB10-like protein